MKKEVFLALVLASVLELKAKGTPEEFTRLGEITAPTSFGGCIIAQMTDDDLRSSANQDRVAELRGTHLVFSNPAIVDILEREIDVLALNSSPFTKNPMYTEKVLECLETVEGKEGFGAFEYFIMFNGANTSELVAFLKGERETFEPTFIG